MTEKIEWRKDWYRGGKKSFYGEAEQVCGASLGKKGLPEATPKESQSRGIRQYKLLCLICRVVGEFGGAI